MKKILLSAAIIAALGALVVNSTAALFSDQESVAGNTVAAGTLVLTLNKSAGKPYSIGNAYPGYTTDWEYIDIYNQGTLPFEAYLSFNKTGGDDVMYNSLNMEIRSAGGDGICNTSESNEYLIYNGLVKDFTPQSLISSLNYWHLANEDDGSGTPADNIQSGYSMRVCQKLSIPSTVGNEIMGKTVEFSEVVDAMQDND